MGSVAKAGVVMLLIAGLCACGGGGGSPPGADPVAAGTTSRVSIASAETGIGYDVDIWLPPGYASSTATYPVVFAMDCEYRFATLTAVMERRANPLILVNVCAMGTARRWVDFTLPGATRYFRFLTRELIPFVDSHYRSDRSHRTLSGHSLSGEFVLYALFLEDPANRFFQAIVSGDCSCWYDAGQRFSQTLPEAMALEKAMSVATRQLPIDLVMAGDLNSNQAPVRQAFDLITGRGYQGLRAIQPTYSLGHVNMDGPSFADALNVVFGTR